MENRYWVSFVEEFIMNEKYKDYVGGRMEVFDYDNQYDIDEIRFFTRDVDEFYKFRDKYDLCEMPLKELTEVKTELTNRFYEKTE